MSVIIDFAIFPMDKGESLSPYVARAIKIINESGLKYQSRRKKLILSTNPALVIRMVMVVV